MPPWHLFAQVELRQGMTRLGATPTAPLATSCSLPTEPPGRPARRDRSLRWLVNGELRPSSLASPSRLNLRAQYAWKPLLSFEEFAAGNYTVGRGYDPGALLGDRGFGTPARAALRQPDSRKRQASRRSKATPSGTTPSIHNLDTALAGPLDASQLGRRRRADELRPRSSLDAALAVPLSRAGPSDKKPSPRLLISLTTRLFPWQY